MTITLPLQPLEEAKLIAIARAKGSQMPLFARLSIRFADAPDQTPSATKAPTRSVRGILAKYGPGPSAEEIGRNRAEMFANFGHD